MKTLTILYRERCPYCAAAKRGLKELYNENPVYERVPLKWIEETEQPQVADTYPYWYVPSIFDEKEKLFEASPADTFDTLKKALRMRAFATS